MARPRLNFPGSLVSDIAQLKMLDGRPATFLRFNGPDRYVVLIDGEERTITRAEWRGWYHTHRAAMQIRPR